MMRTSLSGNPAEDARGSTRRQRWGAGGVTGGKGKKGSREKGREEKTGAGTVEK